MNRRIILRVPLIAGFKNLRQGFLILLAIGVSTVSCDIKTIPRRKQVPDSTYTDDLSRYKPIVVPEVKADREISDKVISNAPLQTQFDISGKLDALVDSMRAGNDAIRLVEGYTILVYSGNDEIEAGRVRNRLFDIVPERNARFSYKLPTYFVKIGRFYQQVEAQPLYRKIRKYYPSVSIVPDKFPIK